MDQIRRLPIQPFPLYKIQQQKATCLNDSSSSHPSSSLSSPDYLLRNRCRPLCPRLSLLCLSVRISSHSKSGLSLLTWLDPKSALSTFLKTCVFTYHPCTRSADIFLLVKQAVWLYCSSSVTDLLGWEPEEIVGESSIDLTHPDESAAIRRLH